MESRGPEDSKNVKTSQAYFFEGFISFFEDFSLTIGRGFAFRPGHTKDHHKNGTNCLPAWHALR